MDTQTPSSEPAADAREARLVERCQRGDQDACRELVERHKDDAFRLAYRFVQNAEDAKDVSQEAFIHLFRSLDRFRPDGRVKSWLYRIIVNSCIDLLRKRKRRPAVPLRDEASLPTADGDPAELAARDETAAQVRRVLDSLPLKYRVVLTLRELEGLSCEEAAATLGILRPTARWRLHQARKLFKTRWEQLVLAKER